MRRLIFFVYGFACYGIFFLTFLYLIGFVGDFLVPKTINGGAGPKVGGSAGVALAINTALIALFGVQHTVMARRGFKQWWTRFVPKPVERATYVLATSLCLILLYWLWQPMNPTLWAVQNPVLEAALTGLYLLGYGVILYATVLIDHFDLFGLRQVFLYLRKTPYTPPKFATPTLYRLVRHPLYVGWIMTFWFTPWMTVGHLVFAIGMTGYILVAIQYEERDLVKQFGESYESYRAKTPMLVPVPKRS